MTLAYDDGQAQFYLGDVRECLRAIPENSVHVAVTSPPYWGLRDYGTARWDGGDEACDHKAANPSQDPDSMKRLKEQYKAEGRSTGQHGGWEGRAWRSDGSRECPCGARRIDNQLGLEATPAEFVANMVEVFREVRRVLRPDGTAWVNMGDSYAATTRGAGGDGKQHTNAGSVLTERGWQIPCGLKPKDLVGIPWMLAEALKAPYYTGKIKNEKDRIWLAAMIDGEGCMFIHKRKAGQSNGQGYDRKSDTYGAGLEVANTSEAIVRRCMEIAGGGSIFRHDKARRQPLWRWSMRSNQCRDVIREIYPYLVGKQHQARLLLSCPSSGPKAEQAHASLIALHNGNEASIDFPPPPSLYEPGWYLRSDIIWAKLNPMPESVTDRPTKAHEYLFLLTKSPTYYYDADAIREPNEGGLNWGGQVSVKKAAIAQGQNHGPNSIHVAGDAERERELRTNGRNKRDVWTIPTEPFSGARLMRGEGDGSGRRVSSDCPRHGDQHPQASTARRGEQPDASVSGRNPHTDDRREPAQRGELAPTDLHHVADSGHGNSDSPDQPCVPTATVRSTGTHKTPPAPATSQRATRDAASPDRTDDMPLLPGFDAIAARTPASSTAEGCDAGGMGRRPSAETASRSERICTCPDDTTITDHFAVFPTALVKPCILAGTSEHGCCADCGAPWERVAEYTLVPGPNMRGDPAKWDKTLDKTGGQGGQSQATNRTRDGHVPSMVKQATTLGWRPTCAHEAPVVPATVLDPFLGSGTTAFVAKCLGRRAVGIDLNAEYLEMAKRRCAQMSLMDVAARRLEQEVLPL